MTDDEPGGLLRRARALTSVGRGAGLTPAGWLLNVVALAVMLTTTWVRTGHVVRPDAALLALTFAAWVPLLFRTYRPVLALAGTVLADACVIVFFAVPPAVAGHLGPGVYQPAPIATMVAAYTLAARAPLRFGWLAGATAGSVLFAASLVSGASDVLLANLVVGYLVLTGTGVGSLVTVRRERLWRTEAELSERTDRAVLEERLRIARELHDVLAHNLTLVNAQAGVAEYLLRTDPGAAATALHDITNHTARAIDDLQATIGLLRYDDPTTSASRAPAPGLARLDDLVASFRSAGAIVELASVGASRPLSEIADLAVYRIAAEALTNATKHAPGAAIVVGLRWAPTSLELEVENALAPAVGRPGAPGTGHGLIGMRERASSAGATLEAAVVPGPAFRVKVVVPLDPVPQADLTERGSSS